MIRRIALLLLLPVLAANAAEQNLLANGDFEAGPKSGSKLPGWTETDGLTTFFVRDSARSRMLKIDTDVTIKDANARWKEMEKPAAKRPKAKPNA